MLLETKIRGSDHSLVARVYAIDSSKIESKENGVIRQQQQETLGRIN